jgi:hypothetical protein
MVQADGPDAQILLFRYGLIAQGTQARMRAAAAQGQAPGAGDAGMQWGCGEKPTAAAAQCLKAAGLGLDVFIYYWPGA